MSLAGRDRHHNVHRLRRLALGEERVSLPRTAFAMIRTADIVVVGPRFRIVGLRHLDVVSGRLWLGTSFFGFVDARQAGLLRIRGRMVSTGEVYIGRGANWDIGLNAQVTIGDGSRISPRTTLVASESIQIGRDCAISWDVQFLDSDWHVVSLSRDDATEPTLPIIVGDHVLIGSRATLLKGARIADGTVVASGSIVRSDFSSTPHVLLAGNPAKIVDHNVSWS